MDLRLKGRILNTRQVTSLVHLLTVHYPSYILEKAMNDLEGLCCRYPSLVLGESIQPFQNRLYVLLSKELLENIFYVSLS